MAVLGLFLILALVGLGAGLVIWIARAQLRSHAHPVDRHGGASGIGFVGEGAHRQDKRDDRDGDNRTESSGNDDGGGGGD